MKSAHRALMVLAFALTCTAPLAIAASYSTDQSDLWWTNPPGSENGWGIQFVQRASTIFATMFVYGQTGAPTWYTATMVPTPPGSDSWTGALYATTGSYFGAVPYNPGALTIGQVGTMTWTPASVTTGALSYTVNGVAVTKNLTRQTLVNESYIGQTGRFAGGLHQDVTGCANPAFDGTSEVAGILAVSQTGTTVTISSSPTTSGVDCTYSGTLTQYGQMGNIEGNYTCSTGDAGSFDAFEVQVTQFSLTGRFSSSSRVAAGCQATGWFGGVSTALY